jgi:hypothetical protein
MSSDTRSSTKVMPPIFFSENITAITVKLIRIIHISFAIMGLYFHKVSIIFNTLLPVLSKTLHTYAAKFPASISEHIM